MTGRIRCYRLTVILLLIAMFVGLLPTNIFAMESPQTEKATETAQKRAYLDICDKIPDYDDCNSVQGMAVLGDYIYSAKKNSKDNNAAIYRTNRFDGTTEQMSIDGALSVDYLGHANDMCAAKVGSDLYLFVTTMKKSVDALACYRISGTTLTSVGIFNIYTSGGSNLTCSGLDVYEVKGNAVTLLVAQGDLVFLGTMDMTAPADLYCPLGFQVDKNQMLEVARQACGIADLEMTVQGSGYYNDTYYMPLTLHHNHSTQIKADNHADSTSVIVAFPNIAAAIKGMDREVKASLSDTIYVPDAGEMFFEIESVDFADGMMYFSTNRVRIDHSRTFVSVLLDESVDVDIFTRRAAFRQDGIYMLAGAKATDHFMYDPGAEDGHLLGGVYPVGINTYFGLESNEEGFYYIRSMLTKKYLTVNADCTVTTSEKKENDPSQLFCLTQVNWPNEPGHVAIISLYNYQYLNNEAGTTKAVTTTSGKTYRLNKVKDTAALEALLFDYKLYTACYPEETAGMTEAQALAHYNSTGKAKGYIASIFFDPNYYLEANPGLKSHASYGTPAGAYSHFLNYGFWEGKQGSLFFSCNEYLHSGNDKLKDGNYPDKIFYITHFKNYGAKESLTRPDRYGSDEFAIQQVVETFDLDVTNGYDFLVDYISRNVQLSNVKTQEDLKELLFDWQYYAQMNGFTEEGLKAFAGATFEEKLYSHWTQYGIKEGRVASPYFRASYYRANYSDVGADNTAAYNHFVTTGFWEGRKGSACYDGKGYLYGLNPEKAVLCDHMLKLTSTTPSTCSVAGTETISCGECKAVVSTATLPTVAHTVAVRPAATPTCTVSGRTESQYCSECGEILVAPNAVLPNGHTIVTDHAVAPTETQTGKTEGKHCSVCNTVLVKQNVIPALKDHDRGYYDLCQDIPTVEGCLSMQGMALLDEYIYTVKINSANDKAVIFRTSRLDGSTTQMTIDGAAFATNLGHANDMCAANIAGSAYLFVTTLKAGDQGMVAYKISETSLTTLGVYDLYTSGNTTITCSGLSVYKVEGTQVQLIVTSASYSFIGTVDVTKPAGKITCNFAFQLGDMLTAAHTVSGMTDTTITVQGSCYADGVFYMPIGMGHPEIIPDNHGDSDYVILVYPNIDEAIKNQTYGVQPSFDDSIFIPDYGELFFELETVAVEDGIVYFNTNRIFIDRTIASVSFLTDRESQTELLGKRSAFVQDGLYMLRGSGATDYLVVDPGAADTHLVVQKTSPGTATYFGFESNENGYYYIRSHLSGLYLTVNADNSVTQSAKKVNDPSQLWCLKQVDWPNNLGKVAIISMRNYGYLNLDSSTMTVLTNNSGKTFLLDEYHNTAGLEANLFDYKLYTACYPEETDGMTEAQAKNHWISTGRAKGYVASMFFDPSYYLANEADVAASYGATNYEAAYQHFVSTGFWEGRQGSLFYDCKDNVNYVNFKYDKEYYPNIEKFVRHFYLYGANECLSRNDVVRRGSEEFDLKQVVAEYGLTPASGYDFLVDYIRYNIRISNVKTQADLEKLLFDWEYYAANNPELTESRVAHFAGATYAEKLYSHWKQKGIEEGRIASPYFNAAFYRARFADAGTTNAEAYQHFVMKGFWEKRAGSDYYDGQCYLYGLNPLKETVCDHLATVTAKKASTCSVNGTATTYCCFCSSIVRTVVLPTEEHTEVIDKAVAATCTTAGKTEGKHCAVCNTVLVAQREVPATGHVNTTAQTTDATCTEAGSVVITCACGEHIGTESIAALGHSYEIEGTLPTCTEDGVARVICTRCCITLYTKVIPALGHSFEYINEGDTHRVVCRNRCDATDEHGTSCENGCDYAVMEAHSYVDGICVCGAVEIAEPVLDSSLTFGAQLYLENDLTIAFRVKQDKLSAYDISTAYLVVERDIYESGAAQATVETMTIGDYKIENGRLIFSYPGIAAAQMNDAIRASFYIKDAKGQEYVSPVLNTSVATYLDGLLSASASDTKMVTLIMDMLNYGAAAQIYFDRHADAPVNVAFESFKTYASYASADFKTALENLSTTENAEGKNGKLNLGLDLGTRIGIQYKVTLPANVNVEDVTLVVTDANGNVLETLTVAGNATDSRGRYLVNFYGSTSRDMRRVVYATAYAKGEAITGTYAYSISTYAWGVQENAGLQPENLVNVTRAMLLYGDSAAAYFS